MVDFEFKSMVLVPSKREADRAGSLQKQHSTYACGHIAIFPLPTYDAHVHCVYHCVAIPIKELACTSLAMQDITTPFCFRMHGCYGLF